MQIKQKLTPFLSFNNEAEEAARFYVSVIPDSRIVPAKINEWMSDPDPARSGRVVQALYQMVKLDMVALQSAYETDQATQ